MTKSIKGTFEVNLKPLESSAEDPLMGRMSIDKIFHGPLKGTSKGEMLSVRTSVESSAGYVAIEKFMGSLEGKAGSFVLQHFGIMHGGENHLTLDVVPNSGTEDLANISGKMEIIRQEKGHEYIFSFEL